MSLTSYTTSISYKLLIAAVVILMAAPFTMPPSSSSGSPTMRPSGVSLQFGFIKDLLPSGILGLILTNNLDSAKDVSNTITNYEGRISTMEGKLGEYSLMEMKVNGIEVKNSVDALGAKMTGLDTKMTGIHTEVAGLRTEVAGLHTGVAGLHTEVAGLHTEMGGLHKGMAKVNDEMIALRVAVEKLAAAPAPKAWWNM
jgi:hypothetical protein